MFTVTRLAQACLVIAKYNRTATVVVEHDEMWLGHDVFPDTMEKEDVKLMDDFGFEWQEEIGAWHRWV